MSTDIVDRLRQLASTAESECGTVDVGQAQLYAAAKEIETLRAELGKKPSRLCGARWIETGDPVCRFETRNDF